MACETNTCGTGGWSGPKPGDPDNNSVLTATPAFGGIDVAWSYPTTNPQAVAHTHLYRGVLSDFNTALFVGVVGGGFYYDKQDNSNTHYYWIRFISVNGTEGGLIGPASATARPTIARTIEQLTGRIDSGVLAQSLKGEIDKITLNYQELNAEIANRINSNQALSAALALVQSGLEESLVVIDTEVTVRREGQDALVKSLNTLAVLNQDNLAAITRETEVRVENEEAFARQLETLAAIGIDTVALIDEEKLVRIEGDDALAKQIEVVAASNEDNVALIKKESEARVDADSALVKEFTDLKAATNDNIAAAIKIENEARTNANDALAKQITTVQSTVNGDTASGQIGLTTKVETVDGKVTEIGALYTAKLTVDGMVGGFGVYNDGKAVDAGFDVDNFWIGRTDANKRKPFIVSENVVYLNEAVVEKLTFDKLRAADGSLIVENGQIKGDYLRVNSIDLVGLSNFNVKSANVGERLEMDSRSIRVYDEFGRLRVKIGNLA